MSDSKQRSLRLPIAIFSAIVTLAAFVGVLRLSSAERAWDDVRTRIDEWQEEFEARDRTRSVLWGETHDGEAWPEYGRAFAEIQSVTRADERILDVMYARSSTDTVESLVNEFALALDAVRAGTHRNIGSRKIQWERGASAHTSRLMTARMLANLCVLRFQSKLDAGDQREAVRSLLDSFQLGRDHMSGLLMIDEMIGAALVAISIEGIDDDAWRLLSDESLRELALALAILDDELPLTSSAFRADLVLSTRTLEDLGASAFDGIFGDSTWRWLFPWPVLLADCAQSAEQAFTQYEAVCQSSSADRMNEIDEICRSFEPSPNPFTANFLPRMNGCIRSRFSVLAELRMLRVAIAERLGEELELENPFGSPFIVADDGARIRFSTSLEPQAMLDLPIVE